MRGGESGGGEKGIGEEEDRGQKEYKEVEEGEERNGKSWKRRKRKSARDGGERKLVPESSSGPDIVPAIMHYI